MEDLECRFCNLVFRDPVLLDTFNYYNSCRSCAIGNVVGKGKVKLPDSDLVVEIDDASRLRPNVTLSFLLEELQRESEVREKVLSLLDSLSLFSVVGYDPVPYQVETENTVDLVVQAPERFSTFVDLVAVVDFSASMKGPKSELLKETLKYFIENLDENDRFGVVAFASGVHRVFEIEAATAENKARWIRKLTAASPKNKSNLCGGLLEGLDMLGNLKGRRSNASMVVFTDGMATKGEVEEESILKATKEALQQYNMRVTIHTFGYRKHQVTLMKGLTELYTGQYFYIQSPHQIPESLAISFTDIRRSHFHDIKLAVEIIDTGSVKQIGTKLPVGPLPGTTSMKKGCIVKVNQLSERRQKNILFRVLNPKLASPDAQYKFMRATLTYLDTSLSLRRRQQIVVHIARDGSANAPLKEKQEVTTQWNRILTGTTLEQAAKLGRDKATHDQGIELLVKAMEATRMTDEGDPLDTDSASVFYHTLKKGKKLLEKQATLDDSNFGKLIDMANAFLHEQSSVFIDAYNTDAVDLAIEEIRESTQAIDTEEELVGDTFEEEYIDANGIKLPPPIKKKHPSTRLNDDGKFKIVKGRKMGGEDDELEIPKFRLNSFKKFQPQKEKEVSELYTKLTKGNLSLQEIEARLARNKKQKQSEPMSELDMILKARRKKTQEPQMAYKTLKGRSPKTLAVENDSDDHIAAAPTEVEFTHQALHDFRPRTAQEIELRQGDPVVLIKRQGDFAEVENCRSRRTGLVPFNYLAIILIGENDTSFPTHVALYNFTPRTEQEIELEKDDQIMVTKERNDGYYEGLNTRTENFGLFPATHVAPRITHEAVRDFFSGLSTEVEMKKGDGVIVTKIRDDGWLQGQNVRTGKFGLIPSSFVRKAESQA